MAPRAVKHGTGISQSGIPATRLLRVGAWITWGALAVVALPLTSRAQDAVGPAGVESSGAQETSAPGKPRVDLQPLGRGVRLQTDWSGHRVVISPQATSQNELRLGGAIASTFSSRVAAGLQFVAGSRTRELLATGSWWVNNDHELLLSVAQLRQDVTLPFDDQRTDVFVTQYAGGLGYALRRPVWKLDTLGVELYGSRSLSRSLGTVDVAGSSDVEDELFTTSLRVAGGTIVGLRGRGGLRPWASGHLGWTIGYERLTYDLYAEDAVHDRLAGSAELSQRVRGPWSVAIRTDVRAGEFLYELGVSRETVSRRFGLSVTGVHGRDNGLEETRLQWTHSFTFGEAAARGRSGRSDTPGEAQTRALLDRVSRRPGFLPAQVVAQVDATVPRERLIAIVREGLPAGSHVDAAGGTVTLPQVVTAILAVTRNDYPFANTGQFVVGSDRLEVRASAMTAPPEGVTDEYVVTLTNPDDGVTTVTVLVSKGSVRIDQIIVNTDARRDTPDALQFAAVTGVPLNELVESAPVVVTGINVPVPVMVTDGEYAIDGGAFTDASATIGAGQTVRLRHRAASTTRTDTVTTVVIGGAQASFVSTTEAGPTPESFSFPSRVGVRIGDDVTSDPVVMAGLTGPATVTVSGGMYAVGGAPFGTAPGTIRNGESLTVRVAAAQTPSTTTSVVVSVGAATATFSVTTEGADQAAHGLSFAPRLVEPGLTVYSEPVVVADINTPVPISVAGGWYSINGASYTTAANMVSWGDTVVVKVVSAETAGETASATLSIGTRSAAFTVTTIDAVPDAFMFPPLTGVSVKTNVDSNAITVNGINVPVPITIVGGEYSVSGGAFTSGAATVAAGQTVTIRVRSSMQFTTTTAATLTIGGVSGSFSVTTEAADTVPDGFTFTSQTDVTVGTEVESNTVTISGINTSTTISVSGGAYALHGNNYTAGDGTVNNGDTVTLRQAASAQFSTTTTMSVTIGGVAGTFSVTTEAEDATPDAFSFVSQSGVQPGQTRQSDQVTVSGINVPVTISVSGDPSSEYRVNNDAWTATPGTVTDGDRVRVRHTAAGTSSTTTTTTLTIGGVSGSFSTTTK